MAMLAAYFDDSGSHPTSEIVVYSGLMGDAKEWESFEAAWKAKLQAPLSGKAPLKRFHMADCESRTEEFARYSMQERDRLTSELRQLILTSGIYGITATIPVRQWDDVITGKRREKSGTAEQECFGVSVFLVLDFVSLYFDDKDIALIFDRAPEREEHQKTVIANFEHFNKNNPVAMQFKSISFSSSYDVMGLQAADMIAWESNKYARDLLKDPKAKPRYQLAELNDSHRFKGAFMKPSDLLATAALLDLEKD